MSERRWMRGWGSALAAISCLAVAALAMIAAVGCVRGGQFAPPPGATPSGPLTPQDYYQKAALAMSDFSVALLDAQQIVVQLHAAAVLDDGTNRQIEAAMRQIAVDGKGVDSLISATASPGQIATQISATADALTAIVLSGEAGIKDKNSQTQFVNAIGAIKTALQVVAVYFNSNVEVMHGPSDSRAFRAARSDGVEGLPAGNEGSAGEPAEAVGRSAGAGGRELSDGDRPQHLSAWPVYHSI